MTDLTNDGLIEQRVDLTDIMNYERDMLVALSSFKTLNRDLYNLTLNE